MGGLPLTLFATLTVTRLPWYSLNVSHAPPQKNSVLGLEPLHEAHEAVGSVAVDESRAGGSMKEGCWSSTHPLLFPLHLCSRKVTSLTVMWTFAPAAAILTSSASTVNCLSAGAA